jgi:hypothetical protein
MKQILFFIPLILIGFGIYFKYFYDVPDVQETVNFFTSWFFIIVGVAGLLVNLFWSSSKKIKNND